MILAHKAGVPVFATGGIGGVHRGAETTFDISADLQELGRTSIAVVSAGAKSILDLGLTLEYLETLGVPVLGYQTSDFPSFFARSSGHGVDYNCQSAEEIARFMDLKWKFGLEGGILIANPVPEQYAMDPNVMEAAIVQALKAADQQGIKGKALTPFLLAQIEQITGGNSLKTNIALVRNNAILATKIAREYSKMRNDFGGLD
jgi:pseudouridylate synthase